tara:strand:+ start:846 stop:1175 length:330 start_codon:yes stop_codon:yes gene_type:complete
MRKMMTGGHRCTGQLILGTGEIVAILVSNNADVNSADRLGWTSLHKSVDLQQKDLVDMLITNGSDVNFRAYDGLTPLNRAINRKKTGEIVDLLRKHGAKTCTQLKDKGK